MLKQFMIFILLLAVSGCTSAPYVKKPDYVGQNDFSFGQHSVIIDKRFKRYGTEKVTHNDKIKVTSWCWKWKNERVTVFFREAEDSTVYYKDVDWRKYYKNVIYYEKPQFSNEFQIYTYRMIRFAEADNNNVVTIVTTFHFVGNQKWLITEYYFRNPVSYRPAHVQKILQAVDYMVHIRHNTVPKQVTFVQKFIERLNVIHP